MFVTGPLINDKNIYILRKNMTINRINSLQCLIYLLIKINLYLQTADSVLRKVLETLDEILKVEDQEIFVFCRTPLMDLVRTVLKERNVKCADLTAKVPMPECAEVVDRFNWWYWSPRVMFLSPQEGWVWTFSEAIISYCQLSLIWLASIGYYTSSILTTSGVQSSDEYSIVIVQLSDISFVWPAFRIYKSYKPKS